MEHVIVQSKANNFSRITHIVATFFLGFMGYFLLKQATKQDPLELGILLSSLPFWIFSLWSFVAIWVYYDKIKVFSDRIEVSNWWNIYHKTIYFYDIKNIETGNNNTSIEKCKINLKNGKHYKFHNFGYSNFFNLKHNLNRKGIKVSNTYNIKNNNLHFIEKSIIFTFISSLILGLFYLVYQSENFTIHKDSLVEIPLTLAEKPQIIKGRKGSRKVTISIKSYPKFDFDISSVAYSASDSDGLVENTEGGKKIYLMFDKEEYQQKLSKEKEVTFWNKYFGYYNVDVYGIRDDKRTYLTLDDYITESKSYRRSAFLWVVVFVFSTIFFMRKEINKAIFKKLKRRKY